MDGLVHASMATARDKPYLSFVGVNDGALGRGVEVFEHVRPS